MAHHAELAHHRAQESKLKFKGTSLYPATLAAVLEQHEGVESFVIIARKGERVVGCGGSARAWFGIGGGVAETFQARAKLLLQIRHATREIESLQMPPQVRKRRTFVDLR